MRTCYPCVVLFAALCRLIASSAPRGTSYWRHLATHPQTSYSINNLNLHNDSEVLSLFSSQEQNEFNAAVTSFLNTPTSKMWTPVDAISEDKPFIFYHQRKAGGTSIRDTLAETAVQENFTTYIPCYPPVPCDTFTFPYNKKYALYAGHFQWGSLDESVRVNSTFRSGMSCASNFREPIRRVESCLYFRFRKLLTERNATCIDDLSMEDFVGVLFQYDEYGQGCFNEPFRILSGFQDETVMNHLMGVPAHPPGIRPRDKVDSDVLSFVLKATLEHVRRCPPMVLELPQSFGVMINRSPIFTKHDSFTADTVLNANKHSCAKLSGDKLALVKRYTALETILYDAVFRKTAQRVAEEDPDHYLFRMGCSRQYSRRHSDVLPTSSLNASTSLTPTLLISGNDTDSAILLRESLEFATGQSTGGFYAADRANAILSSQDSRWRNRLAVHVPVENVSMSHSSRGVPVLQMLPIEPSEVNTTAASNHNGSSPFARVVIMFRDPFVEVFQWIQQTLPSYETMTAPELAVALKQWHTQEADNYTMSALYQSRYRWLMDETMFRTLFESNITVFSKPAPVRRGSLRKTATPVVHRFPTDQFLFLSPEALLLSANRLFHLILVQNSGYDATLDRIVWASPPSSSSSSLSSDDKSLLNSEFSSHSSSKISERQTESKASTQRGKRKSGGNGWLDSLNQLVARDRRHLSDASQTTTLADTAFPSLPPHLLSSSSINDEPSTNLLLRSNALLRYVAFTSNHHGDRGNVTDAMLQRLSCTFANIQLRRPLRDKVHGIEAMATYFKARPALLEVVTAEVVASLNTLRIPPRNALFTYKMHEK